jgi:Ceramidase
VTGGVAAASLGLFAMAVAGGWLGPDVGRGAQFCEVSSGPLDQPVNTLSNLGFVVAGLGTSTLARRPGLALAFACLVVLLGPASMAMHATGTEIGGHLDMLSMYLVAAFAVSYAAMRRWARGPAFLALTYVAVVATCELAGLYTAPIPVVHYAGNLAFGVFLLLALLLERGVAGARGMRLDHRWLGGAIASLGVAFAVWNTAVTGSRLCFPHSLYQGHAVWHLLCAVSAYCLFRLYVSEQELPSSPPGLVLPSTASAAHV